MRTALENTRINTPDGVNGNDDCGQMSAWYIFSVMGFYPVTPGSNEFAIGAPQFPEIRITLNVNGKNKTLTIKAKNLSEKNNYYSLNQSDFPDDCLIDFDMKLIDLFAEMDKKNLKISEQIQKEYFRVKELLGRTPSRMELFTYMEDDIYELAYSK